MSGPRLLIVDDESSIRDMLAIFFHKRGFEVVTASSFAEGTAGAARSNPDLILSDIKMPDGNGLDLLRKVKAESPKTPVIMITAHTSTSDAIEAMKAGAVDYIAKPFNIEELAMIVDRALGEKALHDENVYLKQELAARYTFANIIGKGSRMQEIFRTVERIGKVSSTVLLTGESGTGKELIARAIHYTSIRKDKKFVSINCGALPETLLESELFGHERGAFTGAVKEKRGLFTEADNGTLFLDEISETTPTMQVKLLRAIQEKVIRKVGGNEETSVDVRIIAATNKDLTELVSEGKFREDLFYRINVIPIVLPSLRSRIEDVAPLTSHFIVKVCKEQKIPEKKISTEAMRLLEAYPWPGNVRELENTLERTVALEAGPVITASSLPESIALGVRTRVPDFESLPAEGINLEAYLEAVGKRLMREALDRSEGVQTKAAELLRMSFRSFRYYAKKYNLIRKEDLYEEAGETAQEADAP
ncbi:MAG: sigma-54 dependent transcriptional regulator [Acidobacteria bacterium]|nr:sigma-54 dependent transcriptional regulator [Acidobacteriota bacterium]MCA1611781.1 sigma-54 dependent transcriptional regulator [Acidobacteriota bacterium]MCA1617437.1 sigma-54 dependent transcriptional regulator [Acidobacteriota bacterium]